MYDPVHHVNDGGHLRELERDVNFYKQWLVGFCQQYWDSEVFTGGSLTSKSNIPVKVIELADLTVTNTLHRIYRHHLRLTLVLLSRHVLHLLLHPHLRLKIYRLNSVTQAAPWLSKHLLLSKVLSHYVVRVLAVRLRLLRWLDGHLWFIRLTVLVWLHFLLIFFNNICKNYFCIELSFLTQIGSDEFNRESVSL